VRTISLKIFSLVYLLQIIGLFPCLIILLLLSHFMSESFFIGESLILIDQSGLTAGADLLKNYGA
jgi:hypothetical protein